MLRCGKWCPTLTKPGAGDNLRAMTDSLQAEADHRLAEALEATGARDPREYYRTQLKELRAEDADGYHEAVAYYRDSLLPAIAREDADPLAEWTEYGRKLASLRAEGRTVAVDRSGRSVACEGSVDPDSLVLHLPNESRVRAILVALPTELSPAQRATYDWLVTGRHRQQE